MPEWHYKRAQTADELATRLGEVASERGLVRTLLRGLALSMVVAHGAGRPDRAVARLVEYLRVTREVDYPRPLVRHRDISVTLLRRVLGTVDDEDVRPAAESMLPAAGRAGGAHGVGLLGTGAGSARRGPRGAAEQGDRRPPGDDR